MERRGKTSRERGIDLGFRVGREGAGGGEGGVWRVILHFGNTFNHTRILVPSIYNADEMKMGFFAFSRNRYHDFRDSLS